LTAAHCTTNLPDQYTLYKVRVGEWDTRENPDCFYDENGYGDCNEPHQDIVISENIAHPKFVGKPQTHFDIALLRLAKKVKLSETVHPICLPKFEAINQLDLTDKFLDVVGWGRTEDAPASPFKLKVSLKAFANSECSEFYKNFSKTILASQMCVGGVEGSDSW